MHNPSLFDALSHYNYRDPSDPIDDNDDSSSSESETEIEDHKKELQLARLRPGNLTKRVFERELGGSQKSKKLKDMKDIEFIFQEMSTTRAKTLIKEKNKEVFALYASRMDLNPYKFLTEAIEENDLAAVKFIMEDLNTLKDSKGRLYTSGDDVIPEVLYYGNFEILRYFMEDRGMRSGEITMPYIINLAQYKSVEMVKLAMEGSSRTGPIDFDFKREQNGVCVFAWAMLGGAAIGGNMAVIKYLVEEQGFGKYVDENIVLIAENAGYEDIVKYLSEREKWMETKGDV